MHIISFGSPETGATNFEDHLKSMNSSNAEWRQSMCKAFVEKYVAIVSVQSPTSTVSHSIRDVRDTFIERLGLLGGTVGLFTGFSLLSMLDWAFFLIRLFKFLKNRRIENDQENKEDNDLDEVKSIQDSDFHKLEETNEIEILSEDNKRLQDRVEFLEDVWNTFK